MIPNGNVTNVCTNGVNEMNNEEKIREDIKNTNLEEIGNAQEVRNISEKNENSEDRIKNSVSPIDNEKSNYREKHS